MAIKSDTARTAQQQALLTRFAVDQVVDCHCHVLPGVDDGPATMTEAIELCRLLTHDGITDVIATPHQLGRWDGTNLSDSIRRSVADLQASLDGHRIPLRVHAGGEVRLDERIPELLKEDRILTLADMRRYLLLEMSSQVQIAPDMVMRLLSGANVTVILAHAERYESIAKDESRARAWIEAGAVLQVNATSLLGAFGKDVMKGSWRLVHGGLVSVIATDAHSVGTRRPRLREAIDAIARECSEEFAGIVCVQNPGRILAGRELLAANTKPAVMTSSLTRRVS